MVDKDSVLQDYLDSMYMISHSHSTVSSYKLAITNMHKSGFRNFIEQKYNIDEIQFAEKIKAGEFDVYKILKEWLVFLDKFGYRPKSIESRLAVVKGYLRHLGLKIYSEDSKQYLRLPKNIRQREEPLTKAMILRILRHLPLKLQTVVLVLTASGMRIGELVQLKLSDIDFTTNPTTIKLRGETTKTRQSRETFLTAEATGALKDYLTRYFGWVEGQQNLGLKDTMIFGRTSMVKSQKYIEKKTKVPQHLLVSSLLMKTLSYYLEKSPELAEKNRNGRRIVHFHALRKFFRTTVGNVCGRDYAEALIGHSFYMDTYYNLPSDERLKLYLKAEPYLTISDYSKVEQTIQDLTVKYKELEAWKEKFEKYALTNNIQITKF